MPSRYEKNKEIRKKNKKKEKRKTLKIIIFIGIIIILLMLAWGRFIETRLLYVKDYRIESENIPTSFNGLKIVHFSDMHYGTGYDEIRLKNLVEKINSYKPDILIFTGDLIDRKYDASDEEINVLVKYLSEMNGKLGKYAIVGDHDFYNENYENIMYDSNFKILKNNYDTVYYKENTPVLIYGIDNISYGDPRVDILNKESINNIKYKIILLHEPDYIDQFVNDYDVSLVLAGHSHGGQVRIPTLRPLLLKKGSKNYYDDYYKVYDTSIYISNGVGSSFMDFRLGSSPSINVYRLSQN